MKLLVVDDEKDTQSLYEQRFRKEIRSHEVEFAFAYSGDEALTYLDKHDHEPVLVLSDINMPGMSGLELLDHIKHKSSSPPPVVIMVTAYGDAENYKQAIHLGADDFLIKPIDFGLLKEKLKSKNQWQRF